jgi:hypothetical protein
MAAKTSQSSDTGVDELFFRNDLVSLCLLVNRRHRTLRIIDFRAGPTASKRDFVLSAAKREGVEKVFTLVERDEVGTWMRLGFTREGSIPSFYKRNDAAIMGAVVAELRPLRPESAGGYDDDDIPADVAADSPAALGAAKTIQRATELLQSRALPRLPSLKLLPAREPDVRKAVLTAQRAGRALTGFEPFGRDVVRETFALSSRSGAPIHAAWEMQPSFGSALIELLTGPRTEPERAGTIAALTTLCDKLAEKGAASAFAWSPADDVPLASAYVAVGFRRSGVLAQHVIVGGARKDAIMWSKKLDAPATR